MVEKAGIIYVEGQNFTAEFDRVHGYLSGYTLNGERLICKGLGLNLWRAPVDNDKNVAEIWEKAMLKAMTNLVEKGDGRGEGTGSGYLRFTDLCTDNG